VVEIPEMPVVKVEQPLPPVEFKPVFSDFEEDENSDTMEDIAEEDFKEDIDFTEPKAEPMADEEVKPLFDKDPNILDEEIAFKPIDFNVPVTGSEVQPLAPAESVSKPMSFVPPVSSQPIEDIPVVPVQPEPEVPVMPTPAPVVDVITPVPVAPVVEQPVVAPAPVASAVPMPEVAPIAEPVRPVSPITGVTPVVNAGNAGRGKPGKLYYFLLVLLIALSIFTLWLYQKSTGGNSIPDLLPAATPEVAVVEEPVAEEEPKVEPVVQPVATIDEEVVVVPTAPIVEPEPEVVETEAVEVEPLEQVIPVSVPVTSKTITASVATTQQEEESPFIEPINEPTVEKPEYNVSQNESMFVAATDYVADRLASLEPVGVSGADVVQKEVVQTAPVAVAEVTEEVVEGGCANGMSPDQFGCCPGESYTQIENGGYVCCPDDGGDCFPPL
jgi:hypothetical protein